jgi:8-oxo-dGTP pyrophosphatase MutT (NUDIX family)
MKAIYRGAGLLIVCRRERGVEVLLGKRRISPFFGYWSTPGGRTEGWDRDARETALREAEEELCGLLRGSFEQVFGPWLPAGFDRCKLPAQDHRTPYGNPWVTCLLQLDGPVPLETLSVPNDEFSAVGWFPVAALPRPTHACVQPSLRYFGLLDG